MFRSQSLLQINFLSDYGPKTKEAKKRLQPFMSLFKHDSRILKLRVFCILTRSVLVCKSLVYFSASPTSFALAKELGKLLFSRQKLSHSASMQLQIAMNIFYDLMMQCLHCLSYALDRNILLICRQMIGCQTLPHIFSHHYRYIFFCKCHEQNLAWNWYGSMDDCLPFHS